MRGGARIGAGRKKNGKHTLALWVTDSEERALRNYLEQLRQPKHHSPTLAELEAEGQTTIFETIEQNSTHNVVLPAKRTIVDKFAESDLYITWKNSFDIEFRKFKKQSKHSSAACLSKELCTVLNQLAISPTDNLSLRKLEYLQKEIPSVIDMRKEQPDTDNLVESFMKQQGYVLVRNNDTVTSVKIWKKNMFFSPAKK